MDQKIDSPELGRLRIKLTCDGAAHGLFPAHHTDTQGADYQAMMKSASRLGWRRVFGGVWLGPCCPKK